MSTRMKPNWCYHLFLIFVTIAILYSTSPFLYNLSLDSYLRAVSLYYYHRIQSGFWNGHFFIFVWPIDRVLNTAHNIKSFFVSYIEHIDLSFVFVTAETGLSNNWVTKWKCITTSSIASYSKECYITRITSKSYLKPMENYLLGTIDIIKPTLKMAFLNTET